MRHRLGRRTKLLPKQRTEKFIQDLLDTAPTTFVTKATQPGWKRCEKLQAFVTPGQIIGPGALSFRWVSSPGDRAHLGQCTGNLDAWSASVGNMARHSNYIAFAIMAALASPLLRFTALPEDPAFNFVGPSSGGKTGAVKAGASAIGHPDAIRDWDLTERGLEEAAAAHNDCFLVLNAAEKASPKRRREVLNRVVHMVADRQSTARSDSVKEQLPDLSWRTLLLSTSNKTGAQMAAELNLPWEEQDAVRLIDIPVPGPNDGGIFDQLKAGAHKEKTSTDLIRSFEIALNQNYGVLLRPWAEHLLAKNPERRIGTLIARFLRMAGRPTGVESRIARKFGLVCAAGKIAVEAGLLKWPSDVPTLATMDLYKRAKALRLHGDMQLADAFTKLAEALQDRDLVPRAAPGTPLEVSNEKALVGVRYRQNDGNELVGLRREGVAALLGASMVKPVFKRLRERGAILEGHGGKSARQLPVELKIGTKASSKPRFIVIDPKRLLG